ncbi:MAG: hypothetical protein CMJ32_10400 [Phycisphaerae bacterium]|nr:hypothetical protein [Phycisphaerae bacterium]
MHGDPIVGLKDDLASCLRDSGRSAEPRRIEVLGRSGECSVLRVEVGDEQIVAKIVPASSHALLVQQREGLEAMQVTGTVSVSRPLHDGIHGRSGILLMESIRSGTIDEAGWERFGRELAALHDVEAGSAYGFAHDNHIGSTIQPNGWMDDWVRFNRERRIGHMLDILRSGGSLPADLEYAVLGVMDAMDRLVPARPVPSLIHGDLWSGNAIGAGDGRIVLIDPACSHGDGLADIAMMRLFGGFPESCYRSYFSIRRAREDLDQIIGTYQLYHVLNHAVIFGGGYHGQALSLCRSLLDRA